MVNAYCNPVRCYVGAGSLEMLPEILSSLHARKVLALIWSPEISALPVFRGLDEDGRFSLSCVLFACSNPTVEQIFELYAKTKQFEPDVVIGVGGGTIMDAAKSLCALRGLELKSAGDLRDAIEKKRFCRVKTPWIGIPTTAGTGSEVTRWATVWDPSLSKKRSIDCEDNYARAAIADPRLTAKLPLPLAVSSALDALCHAVESCWAKASNPVSRALALSAVRKITGNMEALTSGDPKAREAMSEASLTAVLAFSSTRTTACHSISYPLTMRYHIPHGVAVSLLLGPVCELNYELIPERAALLDALGMQTPEEISAWTGRMLARAGTPARLRDYGARQEDLEALAPLCITKGRADNNPAALTDAGILQILRKIY